MTRLKRRKELPSDNKNDVRFGTPQEVANYRAKRLAELSPDTIIEIGSGAGFQTNAFSDVTKHVIAVDVDNERAARAKTPDNVISIIGDALDTTIIAKIRTQAKGKTAVFLDPERPPSSSHRTLDEIQPNILEFIKSYMEITPDIAIELPPFLSDDQFTGLPEHEREYISIDGKLNRLTIYFGALRKCDISAVRLPSGDRLGGNVPLQSLAQTARDGAKFVLIPDAAIAHAGLIGEALAAAGINAAHTMPLGNKTVYLSAARSKGPFFKALRIIAYGPRRQIEQSLHRCSTVILHGKMEEDEQRKLLSELRRFCKGHERMHLFLGDRWYLAGD